jgi:SRSO17 transposase
MGTSERFDAYLDHLAAGLGHADRHAGLRGYCTGLMLPLARKSVEPMAASIDPLHASAKHQSLHHFVAKAEWSDEELLRRVAQWVVPRMDFSAGGWWIVDDTGFPKKGTHSVGVARQYCGMLGKQDNCQVAVSVSLACAQGSLPVAWQLYLPEAWASDVAHQRWRIERDYQELKQDFGLGHYEGRGWRGFHHHASLSIAAYGFLMAERLTATSSADGIKKTSLTQACLPFPRITFLAGAPRAQRHVPDSIRSLRLRLSYELIARLDACPCCGNANPVLRI